jgi:hypothetical protein
VSQHARQPNPALPTVDPIAVHQIRAARATDPAKQLCISPLAAVIFAFLLKALPALSGGAIALAFVARSCHMHSIFP